MGISTYQISSFATKLHFATASPWFSAIKAQYSYKWRSKWLSQYFCEMINLVAWKFLSKQVLSLIIYMNRNLGDVLKNISPSISLCVMNFIFY